MRPIPFGITQNEVIVTTPTPPPRAHRQPQDDGPPPRSEWRPQRIAPEHLSRAVQRIDRDYAEAMRRLAQ